MQQTSGHTIKAFDDDLNRLRALISEMGGLAEYAIIEAMRCLIERDNEGAEKIVENDKTLDALEIETERRAVQLIALRAPMAGDLRDVVAALKISSVVERIGDYAKNIARRVPKLENMGKIEPLSLLPEMARIATAMVHDVLNAFVERDAEAAVRVCERDAAVDDFYDSVFRTLLTHMMENPQSIGQAAHLLFVAKNLERDAEAAVRVCERDAAVDDFYDSVFRTLLTHMMENPQSIGQAAHLLFVAKNLERVGDHATNIAEMVYYAATGEHLGDAAKLNG